MATTGAHNWLIDAAGVVRILDFANSGMDAPATDLTGLCFGRWWDRADLAAAFTCGYGRLLDDIVRLSLPGHAVKKISDARRRHDIAVEALGRSRLTALMGDPFRTGLLPV